MINFILNLPIRRLPQMTKVINRRDGERRTDWERRQDSNMFRRIVTEIYFCTYRNHSWDKNYNLEGRISVREKFKNCLTEAFEKFQFFDSNNGVYIETAEMVSLSYEVISRKIQSGKPIPLIHGIEAISEYILDSFDVISPSRRINNERRILVKN